jgi:Flp pilus assembly protein TadG
MLGLLQSRRRRAWRHAETGGPLSGQALVEMALVLPILVGVILVLFQLGILFMVYLAVIDTTRGTTRWLVKNPDTTDASLQTHIQNNLPTLLVYSNLTMTPNPACASLTANACASRVNQQPQEISSTYNVSSNIFLPTTFQIGSMFRTTVPATLPTFNYYMMIEPR